MEYYKILGVDKSATMEEIKNAYEEKVNQFKSDIEDEKRVKAFIKIFDNAYENIILEREKQNNDNTVVMKINEFKTQSSFEDNFKIDCVEYDSKEDSLKVQSYTRATKEKNDSVKVLRRKKKSGKNNSDKCKNRKKVYERNNKKETKINEKRETNFLSTILQLLIRFIALIGVVVLSSILLVCKALSLVSWLVSRLVMVVSIGLASIHGYQIYIGHAIRYEIFILCGSAFIVSLFLPSIVRVIPSIISRINIKLKNYVF